LYPLILSEKKQENHIVDGILSAIGDENLDVYLKAGEGLYTEIINRLGELGIEVKKGHVYPMLEEPVMPLEMDFADRQAEYAQAKADYNAKLSKWNSLQELLGSGTARKVVVLENPVSAYGYIVTP